jgi:uncharacterized membrane protein YvbJ
VDIATVCDKCGAVYRRKKSYCIRCGHKGAFRDATASDIAAFQKKIGRNLNIIGISLIASTIVTTIIAIVRWLK